MILCLTPNPAIDRTLIVPTLTLGSVHRAAETIVAAGGKGLNVARTIHALGGEPFCMGFAGGHAGRLLADLAQREGLSSFWTWTNVETRTCTILVSQNGGATQVDEPGLSVSSSDWMRLKADVKKHISAIELMCISGSLPFGSPANELHDLLDIVVPSGKPVWVDTSAAALDLVLAYPGVCIKVNGHEMSQSVGLDMHDMKSARRALSGLLQRGLSACAITLGSAGALLATKIGQWYAQGPPVRVVSTVGSGDAFLGALVHAWNSGKDWPESLREAMAAGTANALSAGGGQFGLKEFQALLEQIQIEAW